MFQIINLQLSEKDIEKEHHVQLRRWKETRGDLCCKSPPRMHGAKAIMAAEPPSRQDLRQKPTILMEPPLAAKQGGEREKHTTEGERMKDRKLRQTNSSLPEDFHPPLPQTDPSPLLQHKALDRSKESLSSAEHDTYL